MARTCKSSRTLDYTRDQWGQSFDHRASTPDNEYTYDDLDRLTRAEYLVGVQTQNEDFVYDKLGNRTTLKHNGTDVARYTYDALGRRIEKIEYASPSNITTRYYYDGWQVLREIKDNGQDTTQRGDHYESMGSRFMSIQNIFKTRR